MPVAHMPKVLFLSNALTVLESTYLGYHIRNLVSTHLPTTTFYSGASTATPGLSQAS